MEQQIESDPEELVRNAQTTFEALKQKDSELRKKLDEKLSDDEEFNRLVQDAEKYFGNSLLAFEEGVERARVLEAAKVILAKILMTERGRLSAEFMDVSAKREAAEEEVRKLKNP